jgi:ATP-binding cassette subfamily A (ABC1) protein 3
MVSKCAFKFNLYRYIKGVSAADAPAVGKSAMRSVGLSRFAGRPCGEYSGGNKRKLSLAVALVGGPQVLLLDEPSSGMCPLGRRMMWDTIERAAAGLTVVLTTHAMDECEAGEGTCYWQPPCAVFCMHFFFQSSVHII